jgi:hypothetical protein
MIMFNISYYTIENGWKMLVKDVTWIDPYVVTDLYWSSL